MNAHVHTAASGEKNNQLFLTAHLVLEYVKVTYTLSKSEHTSSHSSKWRKEQFFILNHITVFYVKMLAKYESITHSLSTSECIRSHSSKWRKSNHSFLLTILVLEC